MASIAEYVIAKFLLFCNLTVAVSNFLFLHSFMDEPIFINIVDDTLNIKLYTTNLNSLHFNQIIKKSLNSCSSTCVCA